MACLQRWQHTQTQKQQEPQGAEEGRGSVGGAFFWGGGVSAAPGDSETAISRAGTHTRPYTCINTHATHCY